jgi:predicted integral membrane protein DUF2269
MSHQPDGAAFDVVLLAHVGCVVVGLATTLASAATASRLQRLVTRASPLSESMARYFAPGVNWAGRAIYGIPVFGFALLAMSQGAYALHDTWVLAGLGIFAVLVLLDEYVLWPSERRLQGTLADCLTGGHAPESSVLRDARTMQLTASASVALLVLGSALMLAQP